MFDKIVKAICSDFDMFSDTLTCITVVAMCGIWKCAPLSKTAKIFTCAALFFAMICVLLFCRAYFAKIAKDKGIKFVKRAKDSYAKEKCKAIMWFAAMWICLVLFSATDGRFKAIYIAYTTALLLLCLCLILWIEKRHYKKITGDEHHGRRN